MSSPVTKSVTFFAKNDECEVFERCFRRGLPVLLKGPTGCGKSQLVEYMAERLQRPLVKVACNEDTNAADLLGRFLLKGGETVWQDGPVTRAIKQDAILYLDEFAEAREDVVVALHPLTDHRREVYVDKINEVVRASPRFMLVASYNPGYQRGMRELKPSTKQRFVVIPLTYLAAGKEAEVIAQLTGIPIKQALALAKIAEGIRAKPELRLNETVSTRLLVNAASLIADGCAPRRACHYAIADVLSDDHAVVSGLRDYIDLNI